MEAVRAYYKINECNGETQCRKKQFTEHVILCKYLDYTYYVTYTCYVISN